MMKKSIKLYKINALQLEHNDETYIITVPDVIPRDKLVIYDAEGKPLQRKVGF